MKNHKTHTQIAKHHSAPHRQKKDALMQKVTIALAIMFLGIAVYEFYIIYSSNALVNEKIAAEKEAARPANLQVTKILAQSCPDCFDVSQVGRAIEQMNVNVSEKTIDYSGSEAKQLISKYNIKKIPTMLITGEIEKAGMGFWSQVGTIEKDGTLVMRFGAPYIDPSTGTEIGKAQLTNIVDNSCASCYNVSMQETILKDGFGFAFSSIKTYDINSTEGTRLVLLYNITKVPTVIISPDAKYYEGFQNIWKQVGTIEKDGYYVFREMQALQGVVSYKDLSLNKIMNTTGQ